MARGAGKGTQARQAAWGALGASTEAVVVPARRAGRTALADAIDGPNQ